MACGSLDPRTAARPAVRAGQGPGCPGLHPRTRSPRPPPSGSSRPTTSGPARPRRDHHRQPSTARPSTTGGARPCRCRVVIRGRGPTTPDTRTPIAGHSTSTSSASRGRPGARSSCGQLEAPRHDRLRRPIGRTTTSPRTSPRAAREADDLEALPEDPSCPTSAPPTSGGAAGAYAKPGAELRKRPPDRHAPRSASGDGWLSTTTLRGSTYLRAGVVNYLTTEADIDHLLATLRRLAAG